ncbi:hypothetical protein U1Q18_013216 [Sarracenia purpurea var. burkii]
MGRRDKELLRFFNGPGSGGSPTMDTNNKGSDLLRGIKSDGESYPTRRLAHSEGPRRLQAIGALGSTDPRQNPKAPPWTQASTLSLCNSAEKMDSIQVVMTRPMFSYLEPEPIQPLPALELSSAAELSQERFKFNPGHHRQCRSDRISANARGYHEEEGERVHDDEPDAVVFACPVVVRKSQSKHKHRIKRLRFPSLSSSSEP